MEISNILLLGIVFFSIVNTVFFYINNKAYRLKSDLLEDRIDHITKLYLPVLTILKNYYTEIEDYEKAKECKDLIEEILKTNQTIKIY